MIVVYMDSIHSTAMQTGHECIAACSVESGQRPPLTRLTTHGGHTRGTECVGEGNIRPLRVCLIEAILLSLPSIP